MLVLTRKAKQRIQIGDNISITVLRVKGQTVRIGIDAPAEIRVRRSELATFDTTDPLDDPMTVKTSETPVSSCPATSRSTAERDEEISHPVRLHSRVRDRAKRIPPESPTARLRRTEEPIACVRPGVGVAVR